MKRLGVVLAVALLVACGKVRPPQPPGPVPTPSPSESLLLSRNGTVFTDVLGKPVDPNGVGLCCTTDDAEVCDPGWALVSRCAIKDTAERGGNMIHIRLGPYRVQSDWGAEQNSAGSPYLEVNGLADLTQWDPRFQAYLEDKATYAASLGVRLEVDIADGWGIKWQKWRPGQFPQGHPWVASSNVQHEDWITPAGTRAPVGVHEAWIRHAVDMLGPHDNIAWQVGNENGQIPGIVADWEIGTCNIVHDQEAKRGFKRHLCGSNVPELVANRAEIDFLTTHEGPPFTRSLCGDLSRPCRQNEDNGTYTGDLWGQLYCQAKAGGLYRDLWRAGMNRADFDQAFTYLKNGCAGAAPVGCFDIPNEDAIQVQPKPASDKRIEDAINVAINAVYPQCAGQTSCAVPDGQQTVLQKVAAEIRKDPAMCAGIQTIPEPEPNSPVDEICVGLKVPGTERCDVCQGNHVATGKSISCPPDNPDCGNDPGNVSIKRPPRSYTDASDTWKRPGATVTAMSTASAKPKPEPDWRHGVDKPVHRGRRAAQP